MIAEDESRSVVFSEKELSVSLLVRLRHKYDLIVVYEEAKSVRLIFQNEPEYLEFLLTGE